MLSTLPLKLTDRALAEAKYIYENKGIPPEYALRIGMKSGGCGVAGFFIGFDTSQEKDEQFDLDGFKVLIDKRHLMYLIGMELDFEEREEERGFVFNKE